MPVIAVNERASIPATWDGRDPRWRRAPLLLLDFPRVFVSVWIGAALLAFAAAGYPLLLSARTARLLQDRIADPAVTRFGAGITYGAMLQGYPARYFVRKGPTPTEIGRSFANRVADPALGAVVHTELGPIVSLTSADGSATDGRLLSGDGALDHVTPVEPLDGHGVWLADVTARSLGVSRGDHVTIHGPNGLSADVRVAAVYRARVAEPRTGYWQVWDQQIYPKCILECPPLPPPFVLTTPTKMAALIQQLDLVGISHAWQAPVEGDLTLEEARRVEALVAAMEREAGRPGAQLACCQPIEVGGAALTPRLSSNMPAIVHGANADIAGIAGPGRLLQATALVVALAVVAASAASGHTARRTEFRLLFSRGATASVVGVRAALEAVLPAVVGGVAGFLVAVATIPVLGAGARPSGAATASAAVAAAGATIASILVVGVVSAIAFARHGEAARGGIRLAGRVPWELAIGGLALMAYARLGAQGAFVEQSTGIRAPSLAVLFFPVLTIAAVTTLAGRLVLLAAAAGHDRTDRSPPWLFLAIRRITAAVGSSVLFVAAAGLCLGIFVLAQAVVGSLRDTVETKAGLYVGSDVQASIAYDAPAVRSFPLPITRVTRVPAAATLVPGGTQVDVLAVDPRTLADAAFWRDALSDTSLQDIAEMLGRSSSGPLPVAVAGAGADVASLDVGGTEVPVRVVATASAFPGVVSDQPLVVVPAEAFKRRFAGLPNPLRSPGATTQLWVRGPTDRAVAAIRGLSFEPGRVVTADEIADVPHIAIVVGTFSILELLGSLAALLVLASVLLYLQSRQRTQLVAYGLSLRMGLSDVWQRRSIAAEVAGALGLAVVLGMATAVAVAIVLVPLLDPIPSVPPGPFVDLPLARIAAILAGVVVAAWIAARLTNRAARTTDLGQVMRGVD